MIHPTVEQMCEETAFPAQLFNSRVDHGPWRSLAPNRPTAVTARCRCRWDRGFVGSSTRSVVAIGARAAGVTASWPFVRVRPFEALRLVRLSFPSAATDRR